MTDDNIAKNSEILFLYDAKDTNPNGDPDNENQPRLDAQARRLLVTDLRLKRYFRDHLQHHVLEKKAADGVGPLLWIPDLAKPTDGKGRLKALRTHFKIEKETDSEKIGKALAKGLIDVRFFGGVFPAENESLHLAGPVQFTWGESLHEVDPHETRSITSHFTSKEGKKQGTMGKDWRIKYALIGFYGIVDTTRAKQTGLTDDDLTILDKELWNSIVTQTSTRSKIGQAPRLYLRVEYNGHRLLGDLRDYIKCDRDNSKVGVSSVKLDFSDLTQALGTNNAAIVKCVVHHDQRLSITDFAELKKELGDKFSDLAETGKTTMSPVVSAARPRR